MVLMMEILIYEIWLVINSVLGVVCFRLVFSLIFKVFSKVVV